MAILTKVALFCSCVFLASVHADHHPIKGMVKCAMVKKAYKESGCCGRPDAPLLMLMGLRSAACKCIGDRKEREILQKMVEMVTGQDLHMHAAEVFRSMSFNDTYGLKCGLHDKSTPACTVPEPPAWCDTPLCFVAEECEGAETYTALANTTLANLMWSYNPC